MPNNSDPISDKARELLDFVTYRISRVHPRLNAQAAYILRKKAGLSLLQWRIIALLKVLGPDVPAIDLINLVHMDKGLFSRTLKTLTTEGFVTAQADESDHRRSLLSITKSGEEIYESVIATMRKRQEHLLHNFTNSEKSALFRALDKLEINARRKDF